MVGQSGLEPPTSRLSVVCSNQLSYWPIGGDERNRTADPLLARQVLSQLSYTPIGADDPLSASSFSFLLGPRQSPAKRVCWGEDEQRSE